MTTTIASGLYCAILLGGHVTGAHFNPAISLAAFIRYWGTQRDSKGGSPRRSCVGHKLIQLIFVYWLAQFLGAIAGYSLVNFFLEKLITRNIVCGDSCQTTLEGIGLIKLLD